MLLARIYFTFFFSFIERKDFTTSVWRFIEKGASQQTMSDTWIHQFQIVFHFQFTGHLSPYWIHCWSFEHEALPLPTKLIYELLGSDVMFSCRVSRLISQIFWRNNVTSCFVEEWLNCTGCGNSAKSCKFQGSDIQHNQNIKIFFEKFWGYFTTFWNYLNHTGCPRKMLRIKIVFILVDHLVLSCFIKFLMKNNNSLLGLGQLWSSTRFTQQQLYLTTVMVVYSFL